VALRLVPVEMAAARIRPGKNGSQR
jgi:hypothetical protein